MSSPRRRGSRLANKDWMPACAGMTYEEGFLRALCVSVVNLFETKERYEREE
ncbi:MAG: hypothetical protein L6Q53_18160 [Candidatus Brocadia sinica]|nr:hypothetical protein [Candidatus Brocadia sinica]